MCVLHCISHGILRVSHGSIHVLHVPCVLPALVCVYMCSYGFTYCYVCLDVITCFMSSVFACFYVWKIRFDVSLCDYVRAYTCLSVSKCFYTVLHAVICFYMRLHIFICLYKFHICLYVVMVWYVFACCFIGFYIMLHVLHALMCLYVFTWFHMCL